MCNTCGGHPAAPRANWGPYLLFGGLALAAAGVVVMARENHKRPA